METGHWSALFAILDLRRESPHVNEKALTSMVVDVLLRVLSG